MARAIGIDIGTRFFKIVEVEGGGKKFKILRFYKEEIPPSESETDLAAFLSSAIQKALKQNRFRTDQVAISISACNAVLREIEVPFTSVDQIRKTIRFEAEHVLHSCDIDDVTIDFFKMREVGETSKVMVIAAHKDALKRNLGIVERIGLDPLLVDLDVGALYNAFCLTDIPKRFRSVLVVDIGARSTKMFTLEDGQVVMIRAIRMGADSLTDAIQRDLELDFEKAEKKKVALLALPGASTGSLPSEPDKGVGEEEDKPEIEKSHVELEKDLILQKEDEYLSRISREINRSLASTRAVTPVEAIFITGGGSLLSRAKNHLQQELGKEVRDLDLLSFVSHSFGEEEVPARNAEIALGLGLGVKLLGCDPLGLDFRKDEFRFQKKFDQIKVALGSCITLIFLLFLLAGVFFKKNLEQYQGQYSQTVRQAEKQFQKATRFFSSKTERDRLKTLNTKPSLEKLPYMKSLLSTMNKKYAPEFEDMAFPSALELMREFFTFQKKTGLKAGDMFITSVDCKQENMKVDCFAESTRAAEVLQALKSALRGSTVFTSVRDTGLKPNPRTGATSFSIIVERGTQ